MKRKFLLVSVFLVFFLLVSCDQNSDFTVYLQLSEYPCVSGNSAAYSVCNLLAHYGRTDLGGHDDTILPYLKDSNGNINSALITNALNVFASSNAQLKNLNATDDNQNLVLSLICEAIDRADGSILPLDNNQYVLFHYAKGEKINNRMVAEYMEFYNTNGNVEQMMANIIKQRYKEKNSKYWYIVCNYNGNLYNEAVSNYNYFKSQNGTYYGAPVNYRPGTGFSVL